MEKQETKRVVLCQQWGRGEAGLNCGAEKVVATLLPWLLARGRHRTVSVHGGRDYLPCKSAKVCKFLTCHTPALVSGSGRRTGVERPSR